MIICLCLLDSLNQVIKSLTSLVLGVLNDTCENYQSVHIDSENAHHSPASASLLNDPFHCTRVLSANSPCVTGVHVMVLTTLLYESSGEQVTMLYVNECLIDCHA